MVKLNAITALVLGVISIALSAHLWMRFHIQFPVKDIVHQMPLVQAVMHDGVGALSLDELLAPHAGAHRIAITRLLMVLDHVYFGGQNHLIYGLTWLSALVLVVLMLCAFRSSYKTENTLLVFVIGLSCMFIFSHTQIFNLNNPINGSWYMALATSACCGYLIARRSEPPPVRVLLLVYLFALIAAFSNFGGAIIWLLLPVLLGVRDIRFGLLATLLTGLFLLFYLKGIGPDMPLEHNDPAAVGLSESGYGAYSKSLIVLTFLGSIRIFTLSLLFLGAPLSINHPLAAMTLVLFSMLLVAAGWFALFANRRTHNAWLELALVMATVSLVIAISTQMGRVYFSGPTAERYQTVVMTYWLGVSGLLLYFGLRAQRHRELWKAAVATGGLGIALLLLSSNPSAISQPVNMAATAHRVSSLALLGVMDEQWHGQLLPARTADYFMSLDPHFRDTATAYWFNANRRIEFEEHVHCDAVELSLRPSRWPGVAALSAEIGIPWASLYREIPVTTIRGEVLGTLAPEFSREVNPVSMFLDEAGAWRGFIRTDESLDEEVFIHLRTSLFSNAPCRIALCSTQARQRPGGPRVSCEP